MRLCHLQNAGAPVGETEWHHSDGGDHQTHHMCEGSSASRFGNVLMSQTHCQPLSQENVLAMQRQDESLLANMMAHAHLNENDGPHNADVGRTDSKRGLRGAMKPQHPSPSSLAGECSTLCLASVSQIVVQDVDFQARGCRLQPAYSWLCGCTGVRIHRL